MFWNTLFSQAHVTGALFSRALALTFVATLLTASFFSASLTQAGELSTTSMTDGGTLVHVMNGTNRPLNFKLFLRTSGGKVGAFKKVVLLKPQERATWKLSTKHDVGVTQSNGTKYYQVGLQGIDPNSGKRFQWGTLGGPGMYGVEKQTTNKDKDTYYRSVLVQPVGNL